MTNIREVAKAAGVSVATVSRAFQSPDVVSKSTREAVQAAAEKVSYKPNLLARSFRSKKSYNIMVLVPDIANPFFASVLSGIQRATRKHGYQMLLGNTNEDRVLEKELASLLTTYQADGIIQLSASYPLDKLASNDDTLPPLVNACECLLDGSMPTVQLDNKGAAKALVNHLISLGHQRIAIVKGPENSPVTIDRYNGYAAALEEAGIPVKNRYVFEGDFQAPSGKKAAGGFLALSERPTAVFCCNDQMAMGVMQRVKMAGLKIPNDISVAGFDDIEVASYMDPPLTTISQPTEEFGRTAVTLLFEILEGKERLKRNVVLPYEMRIRQSTGIAPQINK